MSDIKLVAFDCDGVLTDGYVRYGVDGEQTKTFCMRDGAGVHQLRIAGIKTALLTGDVSEITRCRAEKLRIDYLHMGMDDKGAVLREIMAECDLQPDNVVYVGDDVNDIPAMDVAGRCFAPADAAQIVRDKVDVILESSGGEGALREVCDIVLKHRS